MKILNAQIFSGRDFFRGGIRFSETVEALGDVGGEGLDAHGGYVIPGLVDIHTHGGMGEDFSDGVRLDRLSEFYAKHGVTTFLATTMTLPTSALFRVMEQVKTFSRKGGARCGGIHLEGPFLSAKKKGAQAEAFLQAPDYALFSRLQEASGGAIRLLTVAPELDGAPAFIRSVSKECKVSLGHSAADYATARAAFEAGASHATHLFNGMSPFLHREPGIVGAAFDSGASVELICDGLHLHPAVIRAMFELFKGRVNLISDSVRCTGMPDGEYELGGQKIYLRAGKAALGDGTLAGSAITLFDGLKNAVRFGIPLADAVYAATAAPAAAVGLDAGTLEVGRPADLLLLDEKLNLKAVFVGGERVI